MTKKRNNKNNFSIKVIFNPELHLDAELIRVLKDQSNMTAYIKFALYHYINDGKKDKALTGPDKDILLRPSPQKEGTVSSDKERPVHQWDKDAAFADAFEPLK